MADDNPILAGYQTFIVEFRQKSHILAQHPQRVKP